MSNVPTIVSPIVQDDFKAQGSKFFVKRDGKPAGHNRNKAKNDKQKISKPAASRKKESDRYSLLEKLLSPTNRRPQLLPVHPCELDLFSSPAVKISHYKSAAKTTRWSVQNCSLQNLGCDRAEV